MSPYITEHLKVVKFKNLCFTVLVGGVIVNSRHIYGREHEDLEERLVVKYI